MLDRRGLNFLNLHCLFGRFHRRLNHLFRFDFFFRFIRLIRLKFDRLIFEGIGGISTKFVINDLFVELFNEFRVQMLEAVVFHVVFANDFKIFKER